MTNIEIYIQILGFIALAFSLYAMTKVDMKKLRWFHLSSSILYLIYGIGIAQFPLIVGAILFSSIHIIHLRKIYSK
ncbi:YgjV family protein [Aquimarina sp. 2201CG5-10]|uniref:YgjV family protein n=1 Tax=Aquimarina callyspongiae TaxID=3098150 RepID=UPI002AB5BF51|nr:YgjV family protein [Aquimarina sp. 2201CG5-10]MDY8136004.1 YgjV family protein [Aquimarina sp. 2201CG5-10]